MINAAKLGALLRNDGRIGGDAANLYRPTWSYIMSKLQRTSAGAPLLEGSLICTIALLRRLLPATQLPLPAGRHCP